MQKRLSSITFVAFLAIGIGALAPLTLRAWEADVHYGLTFWLAEKAGFSSQDAHRVAALDQSLDLSAYTSAVGTMIWVLLQGDEAAAREIQRRHFPSDGIVPSPPIKRTVVANSKYARQPAEAAAEKTAAANALDIFGQTLHPLQDSWSHAGIPDVPLRPLRRIRPNLSFAHPESRRGWWRHDADITSKYVDDAVTVAHETYKLMLAFLANNPRFRKHDGVAWSELEPAVRVLVTGSTRASKAKWLAEFASDAPAESSAFVNTLTLPGAGPSDTQSRLLPVPEEYRGDAPQELISQASQFVDAWLVKKDVSKAIGFVELSALREQLESTDERAQKATNGRDGVMRWCAKSLTMYLVDDHAAVNDAGHGDPDAPGYASLPESPARDGVFQSRMNIAPPQIVADRFARLDSGELGMAIQFAHLPYDAVGFVWRKVEGKWVIVRMSTVVG